MKLYRTTEGIFAEQDERFFRVNAQSWDELLNRPNLLADLREAVRGERVRIDRGTMLAPVQSQEVWASGVTYYRSRNARMEESKDAGGGTFYDRVYVAERPELFFKAAGWRVVGPWGAVRIREDAAWSVPEPELVLVANARGELVGYTVGNDMSSRDIEGENPLYLPQAKVYNASCALGPCMLLAEGPLDRELGIDIEIIRGSENAFCSATTLAELKREPEELLSFLFRELTFPDGVCLFTGTGIVPPDDFTLAHGDLIRIRIEGIGTLENRVA